MIGTTIGPYRVEDRLGAGGMGEVYRARDTRLDRLAALKSLPPHLTSVPEALRRFEREARVLASLNHPNIVTIYSVEEAGGRHFLAMELVSGRTLEDAIPAQGMSLPSFCEVAAPLAEAVAAAHGKGVVHRDLKPGNVMITEEGRVKVLDFGLARRSSSEPPEELTRTPTAPLTREGTTLGTAPYMSPEQVRGEAADPRSDIFSLGCVLYQMATGRRPFSGDTAVEVFNAILTTTPPAVDALRPEMPHRLARIVGRCLEKEPRRRYQSAADLRHDLEDLAQEPAPGTAGPTHPPAEGRPVLPAPRIRGTRALVFTAVALLLAAGLAWLVVSRRHRPQPAPAPPGAIRSLAVLPFENLMHDPDQDYFVEGMHEALITDLSKIGALRVISRTSAMHYRSTTKTVPEIARELDVDALVEGSVLRVGDQVRITAQLIRGATDEHLWAESYDRELRDVLRLLNDVARSIAGQIEVALTPGEAARLERAGPVDPDVYELVLRARHAFNRFTEEGLHRSADLAQQAIHRAPSYAPAHSVLSNAYLLLGGFGHLPLEEAAPRARAAAEKALALDDSLAAAHTALGWVELYFDWRWDRARDQFLRALELDPNDPYARHGYGDYLSVRGEVEAGLEQVELGRKCDPFSPTTVLPVVGHLFMARRYEEAVEEGHRALELFPSRAPSSFLADALWSLGRHREALTVWQKRIAASQDGEELQRVFDDRGPEAAVRWLAERQTARAEAGETSAFAAASWLARASEVDRAFSWLERAYEERESNLFLVAFDPNFDPLRSDPRYRDLLQRMGIAD